ncbi:hypothetical protein [Paraburkholderia phenoliruptrix]|uniref:hypothetical protein n=1 Tax=Paraburkholderia phenoliruptrix TaxID=252970 RepID=UPI0034CE6320
MAGNMRSPARDAGIVNTPIVRKNVSMDASGLLHEQVDRFREWAALYPIHERIGEWECDYAQWRPLWAAAIAVLESLPPDTWTEKCSADLLYAIARDNEMEWIAAQLSGKPDALLKLARLSIDSPESDAKWQLAVQLGTQAARKAEAETLLLLLVDDEDEYVSRRSLLALGVLKSVQAEFLAERAWLTGHEYQRIAALWVLKDVAPAKLAQYVRLAKEDGRRFVVENAEDALKACGD